MLNVEKANQEMTKVSKLLLNDFEFSKVVMKNLSLLQPRNRDHVLFGIRTVIRTAAALIEGVVYQLRLVCIAASKDYPSLYSIEEVLALKEEVVTISDNGKIKTRVSFQQIKPSLAFTFSMFSKIHGIEIEIDKLDNRWKSFISFINIRNGLMHPKSLNDLELISNDDADKNDKNKECVEAVSWFMDNHQRLMRECEKANDL